MRSHYGRIRRNPGEKPRVHTFEAKGLGVAPFKVVDFIVFPMGCSSCRFCGHAIAAAAVIEDAQGRRFQVGTDCVARVGDAGLISALTADRKRHLTQGVRAATNLRKTLRERRLLFDEIVALAPAVGMRPPEWPPPKPLERGVYFESEQERLWDEVDREDRASALAMSTASQWLARAHSYAKDIGPALTDRVWNLSRELDAFRRETEYQYGRRR